jgi:hypothetical protein
MSTELFEWMVNEKIAKNNFNAAAILNGLKLYNEKDDEKAKVTIRLYRDHRNSGEKSKVAFEKAIKGEAVPAPMFAGVLHSEEEKIPTNKTYTRDLDDNWQEVI